MPPTPRRPVHALHGGAAYAALGDDFSALERRGQIVDADVLDAWYDPSPRVIEAIAGALSWMVRTSPPTHAEGLERLVAETRGIPRQNLLVGAGSSALAYATLPQVVHVGDRPLLLDPTYGEHAHLLEVVLGMRCRRWKLSPEAGFRVDADALAREAAGCDVVVLVNPNSPTGSCLSREEVVQVLSAIPRFGWLVVDETYIDFAPGVPSVETLVPEHDNLVVIKSLSKWLALSGVRVGYVAGPEALVEKLRPASPPWSIGTIGQVAAIEALRDPGHYEKKVARTHVLRDALAAELGVIPGLRVHPSVTNFLLLELLGGMSAAEVASELREHGVLLRDCDSLGETMQGRFLRTAVKDERQNQRIVDALRDVVPPPVERPRAPAPEAEAMPDAEPEPPSPGLAGE